LRPIYAADSSPDFTVASLESARAILEYCKPQKRIPRRTRKSVDACWIPIRDPKTEEVSIFNGFGFTKVPSLDSMFAIYDGLAKNQD